MVVSARGARGGNEPGVAVGAGGRPRPRGSRGNQGPFEIRNLIFSMFEAERGGPQAAGLGIGLRRLALNIRRSSDAVRGVLERTLRCGGSQGAAPGNQGEIVNEYLALELIRQRTAERTEEARQASLAHRLRLARRQRNRDEALVRRPVPDYVDGSFRTIPEQVEAKPVEAVR